MFSKMRGDRSKKNSRVLREKESQSARISAERLDYNKRVGFWLVGWLIGWLVGWLVDWLIGWLVK